MRREVSFSPFETWSRSEQQLRYIAMPTIFNLVWCLWLEGAVWLEGLGMWTTAVKPLVCLVLIVANTGASTSVAWWRENIIPPLQCNAFYTIAYKQGIGRVSSLSSVPGGANNNTSKIDVAPWSYRWTSIALYYISFYQYKNPNMNNKDHLVGQLTRGRGGAFIACSPGKVLLLLEFLSALF